MEFPLDLGDREFIDACVPGVHQPFSVGFPILIAVGPEPIARVIAILVRKSDGDAVVQKCPDFLGQSHRMGGD